MSGREGVRVRTLHVFALLALCGLALPFSPVAGAADDTEPPGVVIRVVLIDGQNNHAWRATTPLLKRHLEACKRFTVDVATSPQIPSLHKPNKPKNENNEQAMANYRAALEKYEAALPKFKKDLQAAQEAFANWRIDFGKYDVVVSNYNGQPWPKAINDALEERLREGKIGLVIVHAANNSFGGWKEYNEMIGLGWRGNNAGERLILDDQGKEVIVPKGKGPGAGHGRKHAFKIVVRNADHPITKGMPREWMHTADELYHGLRGPGKNMKVLATAYSDKGTGGTGDHEPMIWTVSYGKGRVFHTPMGHDLDGMRCVGFLATLQRGTEWAATGKVTIPLPANFPTADRTSAISGGARR
jgi:type 1 glutamine amidotransferase